jgi:RHS repeat-associated protein
MQTALRSPIPDASLAVFPVNAEKPHQGVPSKNPALYPGHEVCNCTMLLGLRGQAELNRIGSCSTGKEHDSESGNDYFGARYYASSMGRFLSPDPSQLYFANPAYPQSLNLYTYGRNNPLVNIDPTGMDCVYDDGGGNFHTTTGDCDNSTEALANAGHYINCDGCTTNSTGGTLDPTTGTMYLTDANGNGIAGTNISDWAAPQGTPATNVDVGGRSNDVWMSGYGLGGQLAYFPMAAMPQLPNGSVRDPIAPRHGANLRQWWTAVWGCLSSTDTAPRGVQAPPSSTETDSNPAADVRTYSDSREQGHQVSEPFGNARASGAAENYGNAAALFQDFNNCVSRNLAGFVH